MCIARSWTSNRPVSCLKNPAHLLPIFRRQIPGGEGWDGDISYGADFLASLRLGDLAFPSRSCPIPTLSGRDAKPQRFSKAIRSVFSMLEFFIRSVLVKGGKEELNLIQIVRD